MDRLYGKASQDIGMKVQQPIEVGKPITLTELISLSSERLDS